MRFDRISLLSYDYSIFEGDVSLTKLIDLYHEHYVRKTDISYITENNNFLISNTFSRFRIIIYDCMHRENMFFLTISLDF